MGLWELYTFCVRAEVAFDAFKGSSVGVRDAVQTRVRASQKHASTLATREHRDVTTSSSLASACRTLLLLNTVALKPNDRQDEN